MPETGLLKEMGAKKMLKRFLEKQGSLGRRTCSKRALTCLLQEQTVLQGCVTARPIHSTVVSVDNRLYI